MMNGIERITQRIDGEAQVEIDRITADAKEKAAQIAAKYRTQAEREASDLSARNVKAAAEREERLVSVSQMEARKVTLAAKQEMVEKAFSLALDQLCSLPEKDYIDTVAGLLILAAPAGRGQVIFSEKDRDRIGAAAVMEANRRIGGKLILSDETRPIRGGFILSDINVEVNCTFETLVRLQKGEMAGEVAGRLFPKA